MCGEAKLRCHGEAVTEGLFFRAGQSPAPPHRLPKARASSVRGDVGIAPYVPSVESACVSLRVDKVVHSS